VILTKISVKHDSPTHNELNDQTRYFAKGDLRKLMKQHALPILAPFPAESISMDDEATQQALVVSHKFNTALATDDAEALEDCFFTKQAFWKDQLALTWHLRTFISPAKVASALLETKKQRDITGAFEMRGKAQFARVGPNLVSWLYLHIID
jgi:hypothetical protein